MTASAGDVSYYLDSVAVSGPGARKIDFVASGAYIKAKVDLGPAYVGISAQYFSGDEGSDRTTARIGSQRKDLHVGLILGDHAFQNRAASSSKSRAGGAVPIDGGVDSSVIYSIFGGLNTTPKLNVNAILVTAPRSKEPAKYFSKSARIEFDVTAEYQIYDSLSYMVGGGYLWTGDYFKGTNSAGLAGNDYILMNRLSLSF